MEAEGFTCIKFDGDFATPHKRDRYDRSTSRPERAYIVEVMHAVREALNPATDLALDLHGSYNLVDALTIAKDLEPLDLLWLEDPVRWEWGNVDALAKITTQTSIPDLHRRDPLWGQEPPRAGRQAGLRPAGTRLSAQRRADRAAAHRRDGRDVLYERGPAQHEQPDHGHRRRARLRHDPQLSGARIPQPQHPAVEHDARSQRPHPGRATSPCPMAPAWASRWTRTRSPGTCPRSNDVDIGIRCQALGRRESPQ